MSQTTTNMNCTDYKNALTAEPGFQDESRHARECADCQAYRDEILALDERLIMAMEVSVPDLIMPELPVIAIENKTENVVDLSSRRATPKPVWYAMAATVLIAAVVGLRMMGAGVTDVPLDENGLANSEAHAVMDESYGTLAEQVLAHVDREPLALQPSRTPVSDSRLSLAVPENVATMNHDAGLITYAESCIINGKHVPHLVIQGARGPITILLMPEERLAEATILDGVNIKGIMLPVGNGSIAIIGDREEQLDQVRENVLDSVMWST
jgi:hypothetical protein